MGFMRRTVAELVLERWGDHRPGLWFEGRVLSHHMVTAAAAARAALLADLLPAGAEPHLGVLLDNTPEYPMWLSAAALGGAAVAGINPTRRGPELARDILHTECRVLITERTHLPLLDGLELPGVRVLVTGTEAYEDLLAPYDGVRPEASSASPDDRLLLYFTSGSTGAPKAAICTQGRLAAAGHSLVDHFGVRPQDTHYICMPMFHGNAVIADWAPALAAGARVALRRRFSASGFLPDVRACGATYFTYVGRAVQYLLATPARPDDRDNPLRTGFGTEAGAVDAAAFEQRFGVRLVEGYGSSEGGAAIQRTPGTPAGAIGRAASGDDLAVIDPETRAECPAAVFGPDGRLLNGSAAIGELVNRGASPFEGYWRNPAADLARRRDGWYWTGDLFYRDCDGFLYFMRPHGRPAARRQREPRRRDDREHPRPVPGRGGRRGVRGAGPGGGGPGDGDGGAARRCPLRPARLRRLPGRAARPGDQDGAPLRADRGADAGHRHQQDPPGGAAARGLSLRRPGVVAAVRRARLPQARAGGRAGPAGRVPGAGARGPAAERRRADATPNPPRSDGVYRSVRTTGGGRGEVSAAWRNPGRPTGGGCTRTPVSRVPRTVPRRGKRDHASPDPDPGHGGRRRRTAPRGRDRPSARAPEGPVGPDGRGHAGQAGHSDGADGVDGVDGVDGSWRRTRDGLRA